ESYTQPFARRDTTRTGSLIVARRDDVVEEAPLESLKLQDNLLHVVGRRRPCWISPTGLRRERQQTGKEGCSCYHPGRFFLAARDYISRSSVVQVVHVENAEGTSGNTVPSPWRPAAGQSRTARSDWHFLERGGKRMDTRNESIRPSWSEIWASESYRGLLPREKNIGRRCGFGLCVIFIYPFTQSLITDCFP